MEHFMGKWNAPCPCGSGQKWKKCDCAQYHDGVSAE